MVVPDDARRRRRGEHVCKGESKPIAAGTGQLQIALIVPDDFPGRTTREVLFPIGESLAKAEHAKVLLVADVDAALKLVHDRHWADKSDACTAAPGLAAVLGQKYPNLSTAHVSLACDDKDKCELHVDLERHGRPSADRWVRYTAALAGDKTSTKVIATAGGKLVAKGVPPDAPTAGLAESELADGSATTRKTPTARWSSTARWRATPRSPRAGPRTASRTTSAATGPTGSCRRSAPRWR